jgi:hypothetical protein
MRPVTSQSQFMIISDKFTEGYGAGSYRAFIILFIGLGLLVIGLLSIFIIISGRDPAGQHSDPSQGTTINRYYQKGLYGLRE